jgi:hypothetical protein
MEKATRKSKWFSPKHWKGNGPTKLIITPIKDGTGDCGGEFMVRSDKPVYEDGAGPVGHDTIAAIVSLAKKRVVITAEGITIE